MENSNATSHRPDIWRLAVPGFCASFVSVGLARFAYSPLLPALVSDHWFSAHSASYLAAANLAGYLLGAICAEGAARALSPATLLRGAMLLASVSLFACAVPGGFEWFFSWRLFSGVAGGAVMIMASSSIVPHVSPHRRGFVSGAIFMGIGIGIAVSGTLVPLLLRQGVVNTWLGLGVVALVFTAIGWKGWLPAREEPHQENAGRRHLPLSALRSLYLIYGLNAFALVPHMVFLVDFVARGLEQGLASGSEYWVIYGLGATVGPLLAGRAVDRWGARTSLMFALVIQVVFIMLPSLTSLQIALMASSAVIGACTIGIVPLVLGRTREILLHHPSAHSTAWRTATASFALFQAGGAYCMSLLFDWSAGDYHLLFALGAGAIALAIILNASVRLTVASRE
jgi:predicted MFS family arabinose efflux permease